MCIAHGDVPWEKIMTAKMLLAVAAALLPLAPAAAVETLTATFTQPDGGVTTRSYDGVVRLTVSGTGFANGNSLNDAFYNIASETRDPAYYQLTFGTAPLVAFDPAQDAVNFIVGSVPAYSATHSYSFLLDTGAVTPTKLHFGVGDGVFGDNGGAYTITVSVPEPATWAMMLAGFGVIGLALRRASRTVAA